MVLHKYLGYKTINNEQTIVDSLLEHSTIDEEELLLLKDMTEHLCSAKNPLVCDLHSKITLIRKQSTTHFQQTEDHIIQAHFDFQKQYDFLRIYQRIESISYAISTASNKGLLLVKLGGQLPSDIQPLLTAVMERLVCNHGQFKQALHHYEHKKSRIIPLIHAIKTDHDLMESSILEITEIVYQAANNGTLLIGHCRTLESLIDALHSISKKIEDAAIGLEWLLIN